MKIIDDIERLYQVIQMTSFRKKEDMIFDLVPLENLCEVNQWIE